MDLSILGCGRFQITSNYNSTGNLVSTAHTNILVDFGRGCLKALTQLGKTVEEIDAICITHVHPDHVADLLSFFQIYTLTCPTKSLTIVGPVGIDDWVETVLNLVYETRLTALQIIAAPAEVHIGDVWVSTAAMVHSVPDVAYRFTADDSSIVYSGDTGFTPALIDFAEDCDLLLLECSNASGVVTEYHLNPEQCGQVATQAAAKHLVLTHYGAKELEPTLLSATSKHFNGILTLAKELSTFEL